MSKQELSSRNGLRKEEKCCGDCCFFEYGNSDLGLCNKSGKLYGAEEVCSYYVSIEQAERYLHVLTEHNKWRRDDNVPNSMPMQDPKEIGLAIDFACDYIKTFMNL